MKEKTITGYAVIRITKQGNYDIYKQMNRSYCIYEKKKFAINDIDDLGKDEKIVKVEIKLK